MVPRPAGFRAPPGNSGRQPTGPTPTSLHPAPLPSDQPRGISLTLPAAHISAASALAPPLPTQTRSSFAQRESQRLAEGGASPHPHLRPAKAAEGPEPCDHGPGVLSSNQETPVRPSATLKLSWHPSPVPFHSDPRPVHGPFRHSSPGPVPPPPVPSSDAFPCLLPTPLGLPALRPPHPQVVTQGGSPVSSAAGRRATFPAVPA